MCNTQLTHSSLLYAGQGSFRPCSFLHAILSQVTISLEYNREALCLPFSVFSVLSLRLAWSLLTALSLVSPRLAHGGSFLGAARAYFVILYCAVMLCSWTKGCCPAHQWWWSRKGEQASGLVGYPFKILRLLSHRLDYLTKVFFFSLLSCLFLFAVFYCVRQAVKQVRSKCRALFSNTNSKLYKQG